MTNLGGYIQALLFAALFLIFINGDIGWALIYVIAGTAVISSALLFISKKNFMAELCELSGTANVGERVEFEILLKKTGFCFIPYVELCLETDSNISIRTSLLFRNEIKLRGTFLATHCGINKLTMTKAVVRDFGGLFSLKVPINGEAKKAVLPKIVEYGGPEVIPKTLPSDSDETEEGQSVTKGGLPGYEHRDYVPGDSLKRVNYKLSAKKNKLLVRLDESSGFAPTNIYIAENGLPICSEMALALAKKLVIHGGTVKVVHKNDSRSASTPETLDKLREWLAFREYAKAGVETALTLLPPEDMNVMFSGRGEISVSG